MAMAGEERRVTRVVVHKARPGKEETFRGLLHALVPAWGRELPELSLTIFRSATAERGLFIAHVTIPLARLPEFYEWSTAALERAWGAERTAAYLRAYYDCLEESRQLAVVYEDRPGPARERSAAGATPAEAGRRTAPDPGRSRRRRP
jgi:hypothetical protein